ncbi:MAG: hypothetical protein JW941_07575 [Candidatus Coatesbacteria bacterium]|nr:hypothetical protein [Candidatus Coatesbacteria bacterium]
MLYIQTVQERGLTGNEPQDLVRIQDYDGRQKGPGPRTIFRFKGIPSIDHFPEFIVEDQGVNFMLLNGSPLADERAGRAASMPGIFRLDLKTMKCAALLLGDKSFNVMERLNILNGEFAALRTDIELALRSTLEYGWDVIRVSIADGSLAPVRSYARGRPCFLTTGMRPVSRWGELKTLEMGKSKGYEREWNLLRDNGSVIDNAIDDLIGITPDAETVFFTKQESIDGATSSTLWVYRPENRTTKRISESVGHSFRVSADSLRYGFLFVSYDTEPGRGRYVQTQVRKASIFDVDGKPLTEFVFEKPIDAHALDWDIDAEILAYYNEQEAKIVVQRLNGEVISALNP